MAVFAWHLVNPLAALSSRARIGGRPLPGPLRFGGAIAVMAFLTWLFVKLVVRNINQVMAAAPVYEQNFDAIMIKVAGWIGLEEAPRAKVYLESIDVADVLRS